MPALAVHVFTATHGQLCNDDQTLALHVGEWSMLRTGGFTKSFHVNYRPHLDLVYHTILHV